MGDPCLSSGAGGNCARPMRLPDPSPVLDKNRAPMGPEILSSTGAGVWRKAPMAFPDSGSVDKFQSPSKTPGSYFLARFQFLSTPIIGHSDFYSWSKRAHPSFDKLAERLVSFDAQCLK